MGQPMLDFLDKFTQRDLGEANLSASTTQTLALHPNHWRLTAVRHQLLEWYKADRKHIDKRLPGVLLDQMEHETKVLPKYWPPKRQLYKQFKELVDTMPPHMASIVH